MEKGKATEYSSVAPDIENTGLMNKKSYIQIKIIQIAIDSFVYQ